MPGTEGLGRVLLILGGLLTLLGLLLLLAGRVPYPSTGSFDKLRRRPESIEGTASGHRLALTLLLNLAPYWDTGLAFRVLRR